MLNCLLVVDKVENVSKPLIKLGLTVCPAKVQAFARHLSSQCVVTPDLCDSFGNFIYRTRIEVQGGVARLLRHAIDSRNDCRATSGHGFKRRDVGRAKKSWHYKCTGPSVEAAQISIGSAQRSVHTLQAMGLLQKHPRTRRFQLSPKVMSVGCNYLEADTLIDTANPFLATLSSTCNETTNLTEPDGREMVYVARFPSHKHIPIHIPIGRRLPMYCTSAGRAFLSGLPDSEVLSILEESELRAYTPHTVTTQKRLRDLLTEIRTTGCAIVDEELEIGLRSIAVPVRGASGTVVAALNIGSQASRVSRQQMEDDFLPVLRKSANELAVLLP